MRLYLKVGNKKQQHLYDRLIVSKGAVMGDSFGLEQCPCGLQRTKEDAFEDPTFKRSTIA